MATQRRPITVEGYDKLAEIRVLGEQVELLGGWMMHGRYRFAFSEEAVEAARAAGIELDPPEQRSGPPPASLGTPHARGDDAEALALAALIKRADAVTIARAEEGLARDGAVRNDSRLLAAADWLRQARQQRRVVTDDELDRRAADVEIRPELARTLAAHRAWEELGPVMLIIVEHGRVDFATALSWLAEPDEALDGLSPAAWVTAGRDPQPLLTVARQDAARLGQ